MSGCLEIGRARLASALLAGLAAVLLAACGGNGGDDEAESALPPGCEGVKTPSPKDVNVKRPKPLEPPQQNAAVVETSCGAFTIALDATGSPKTVASFANLVKKGVYDGTAFHRIVPDFVIQGGDPAGDGTGGPGYFVDEPPPPDAAYTKGTVAMAKNAAEPPGRSGSQFYVVVAADAGLPADYAILGKVSRGMKTVERIAQLGDPESGDKGTPLDPVLIQRVTLKGS